MSTNDGVHDAGRHTHAPSAALAKDGHARRQTVLAAPSIQAASVVSMIAVVFAKTADEEVDTVAADGATAAANDDREEEEEEDDDDDDDDGEGEEEAAVDEEEDDEVAVVVAAGLVDAGGGLIDCFNFASRCAKRDSTEGPTLPPAAALAEKAQTNV
jgi:hypothetical protein